MAQRMLKHKTTGELFIYTDLLARLPELEVVQEDPVDVVLEELAAETAVVEAPVVEAPVDDFEAVLAALPTKPRKAK